MGFLSVNRPRRARKRTFTSSEPRKKRIRPSDSSEVPCSRRHLGLAVLPRELMERIFAFSGNLALPQTCFEVARKLTRTPRLEKCLVIAQLTDEGELPVATTRWPFMNVDLLRELKIEHFSGKFVPHSVDPGVEAYMIERGCDVDDPVDTYLNLVRGCFWVAVQSLISRNKICDYRSPLAAIDHNQIDIALALLQVMREPDNNALWQLWAAAQRTKCSKLLNGVVKLLTCHPD